MDPAYHFAKTAGGGVASGDSDWPLLPPASAGSIGEDLNANLHQGGR
jgi:hypothetical protein